MGKVFVKRVGLVLVALGLALMPVSSVGAAGSLGAAIEKSGRSVEAGDDEALRYDGGGSDSKTYCGSGADVLPSEED